MRDGENAGKYGSAEARAAYWRANIKLLGKLLAVWFVVSFGFGILFVDWLNEFRFFGFKLGFWFAQQGSIYVFVALIFIYARKMRALDRKFGVED
jgi:putative solute:sodium symporter small subunit